MSRAADAELRQDLDERGFVHIADFLPADLVAGLRADLDAYAAEHVVPSHYGQIGHNPWQHVGRGE